MQRSVVKVGKADEANSVNVNVLIKKVNMEKQIVYGEVYAPYIIDSHGDMMEPEAVELMAHRFMSDTKNAMIDIMHNNKIIKAVAVESWIQRGASDVWADGAWVLATHIGDDNVWADVKSGKYNGYSFEAMVRKVPAIVTLDIVNHNFGYTEPADDGHDHTFFVEMDDAGKVVGGKTSEDSGHSHTIRFGTATEVAQNHQHRYFLP